MFLSSAAGLGWIGVGCKGAVDLRIWTYDDVSITIHDALVPDYAEVFQKPGFSKLLPNTKGDKSSSSKAGSRPVGSPSSSSSNRSKGSKAAAAGKESRSASL